MINGMGNLNRYKIQSAFLLVALFLVSNTRAQISTQTLNGSSGINTITSAVPFLLISPDSRSGAMGDAGVAISPDANAVHWNPAKLVFIDEMNDMGYSLSYSPWLRALVNDINLAYLSGYKRLDRFSSIGVSLRYFSLGSITFTDVYGQTIRDFNPNEFAVDIAYSRKLSDNFSAGLTARYIFSNLTGGTQVAGASTKPGQSISTDLSFYYQSNPFDIGDMPSSLAFGANISNIGAKMAYTENADRDFIPTNLRLGSALNMDLDEYNKCFYIRQSKSNKSRRVIISDFLISQIKKHRPNKSTEYLCPFTKDGIQSFFRRFKETNNIEELSIYDCTRRQCAKDVVRRGVPLPDIAKTFGWSWKTAHEMIELYSGAKALRNL